MRLGLLDRYVKFKWIKPLYCNNPHPKHSLAAIIINEEPNIKENSIKKIRAEAVSLAAKERAVVSCEILGSGPRYTLVVADCKPYVAKELVCYLEETLEPTRTYEIMQLVLSDQTVLTMSLFLLNKVPGALDDGIVINQHISINKTYKRRQAMEGELVPKN